MTVSGAAEAAARLDARCRRAEEEYPRLAAPDGTVAVPIGDLRLLLNAASVGRHPKGHDAEEQHGAPVEKTPMRTSTPTVADDGKLVDDALRAIELGLQFAYENGLHEFGYDPVAVVRERIATRLEQHPNPEASK